MKTVVYHNPLYTAPETRIALQDAIWETDDPDDWQGYWRCMKRHWERGEQFLMFDHDLVPTREQMQELWDCPEPYCVFAIHLRNPELIGADLGQKFGQELLSKLPSAMADFANELVPSSQTNQSRWPFRHWWHLCLHVNNYLLGHGVRLHFHEGVIAHHPVGGVVQPAYPPVPIEPQAKKIVIPYARGMLEQETALSAGVAAVFEPIDPKDDEGYYNIFEKHWHKGEGMLWLEHDFVPTLGQLDELWNCPEDYCAFPVMSRWGGLGCPMGMKYSAGLMSRFPNFPLEIWQAPDGTRLAPQHWYNLAITIEVQLGIRGVNLHEHKGEVKHLAANLGYHPNEPKPPYG